MSRCPTFTFLVSIISKLLAKHIRTNVSLKITPRKRHVYIDIRWPWKWIQYFCLGFWEDERSKIIFLPSFLLVTRLNSKNRNETILLINSDTLIFVVPCIMLNSEIIPTRCNNCVYSSQWLYFFFFLSKAIAKNKRNCCI